MEANTVDTACHAACANCENLFHCVCVQRIICSHIPTYQFHKLVTADWIAELTEDHTEVAKLTKRCHCAESHVVMVVQVLCSQATTGRTTPMIAPDTALQILCAKLATLCHADTIQLTVSVHAWVSHA